ncbi:MAG: tripartite tricarboxylate transporter TctB family protein [Oribacterium sp.]|jgi:hypothetical protein|nr:tripartite tricarboxylate transporter TctB family protein [Oribacterium sp.]
MDKKKTVAFANLVGAIIFILFGIWAYVQTLGFKEVTGTVVQPAMFPQVMIVGILIFAAVLLIQSILKLATMKPEDAWAQPAESLDPRKKDVRAAYIVILLSILFVLLFVPLGYILDSFIVSVAIMYLIGKRNPVEMLLVGFLVPLGMYIIFHKVLTVIIPLGPLQFIGDLLDKI